MPLSAIPYSLLEWSYDTGIGRHLRGRQPSAGALFSVGFQVILRSFGVQPPNRRSDKESMQPKPLDSSAVLAQFNQLMKELLGLGLNRYTFQPWEVEILLDLESWKAPNSKRGPVLRRYRTTVRRDMLNGARLPLRFAEFLQSSSTDGSHKPAPGVG